MNTFRKWITRTLLVVAGLAGAVFALSLVMVLWSDPSFKKPSSMSAEELAAAGTGSEQGYPFESRRFRMRDGVKLHAQMLRPVDGDVRETIVYVHGILGASLQLNTSASLIANAVHAEVVAVDLRGHGSSTGNPGDVDHIGQYEEDLADVIAALRAKHPQRKVILAGHSMGGGIALRHATNAAAAHADAYLLLAPYLGWSSPTTRKEASEGQATQEFMNIHIGRIIGLKLLNSVGIHAFDGLRTQFFNLPPQLPLRSYTYRAGESMAPADFRAAVAAVDVPLLVVIGSADEAFIATEYSGVIREARHGAVTIIDGASHDGVLQDARAIAAIAVWITSLGA